MDKQLKKVRKEIKHIEKLDKKRDSLVEKGKKCPSAGHMPKRKNK